MSSDNNTVLVQKRIPLENKFHYLSIVSNMKAILWQKYEASLIKSHVAILFC